ncbi:MAG: hypothetical protein JO159_18300 [Acidobacteria bacterium]|nr:hypothetical protein [Acidobacteriota bacterium]MBV9625548.1 hypothetical protein [Acidobacteriota bacterium]
MFKAIKRIPPIVVLISIIGCGGGNQTSSNTSSTSSQSNSTPGQAQGVYSGTDSQSRSFESIILPNDTYWAIFGTVSGNVFTVSGMLTGQGTSNNGKYTAKVTDFHYTGTSDNGSVSASYVTGSSISGTLSESGSTSVTFNGTFMPTSSFNYNSPANLANISGAWSGTLLNGTSAAISVNGTGAFSGSDSTGCSFSGTLSPDASGKNFFNVSLTYGASPCSLANQTSSGIAVDYLLSDGVTNQLVAGVASGTSSGTVFIANR